MHIMQQPCDRQPCHHLTRLPHGCYNLDIFIWDISIGILWDASQCKYIANYNNDLQTVITWQYKSPVFFNLL